MEVEIEFEQDCDVDCPLCGGPTVEVIRKAKEAQELEELKTGLKKDLSSFYPKPFQWKDPLMSYQERVCPCCNGEGTINVLCSGTASDDIELEGGCRYNEGYD